MAIINMQPCDWPFWRRPEPRLTIKVGMLGAGLSQKLEFAVATCLSEEKA